MNEDLRTQSFFLAASTASADRKCLERRGRKDCLSVLTAVRAMRRMKSSSLFQTLFLIQKRGRMREKRYVKDALQRMLS